MSKRALITGITGQDGSYLAELLLGKGYEVHGIRRSASLPNLKRIEQIPGELYDLRRNLFLHYGDMTDSSSLRRILEKSEPDEVYHLAAQSHVRVSFESPEYTADVDAMGVLRLLDNIRAVGMEEDVRFYQASTSELYGKVQEVPQTETTPFYPRSPYGVSKLFGYWMVVNHREAYDMHTSNGILFNHESPRRGHNFVTRKITQAVARIARGSEETLSLGNLAAKRDWGFAPDYVRAMWLILQQDHPGDYVIATGETHSVREFAEAAFQAAGIEIEWRGEGLDEEGVDPQTGRVLVDIDPWYFRPTEVDLLIGDAAKAREELGWTPSVTFDELVRIMVEADLAEHQGALAE